jgi:hypothetical protein
MTLATQSLNLEVEAALRLKTRLIADFGEDTDLMRDVMEGNFNFQYLIGRCTEELATVTGMIDGIERAMERMNERLERHALQSEKLRDAIRQALDVAEIKSIKTPAATMSLRKNPPSVVIVDEAAIPEAFMVYPLPIPNRRAIKEQLQVGAKVPGCSLSNQPESLAVKFT